MKIGFLDTVSWDYNIETPYRKPLGGTQSGVCYLAEALAKKKHEVFLLNETSEEGMFRGVICLRREANELVGKTLRSLDVLIIVDVAGKALQFKHLIGEKTKLILWIHSEKISNLLQDLKNIDERNIYDGFAFVSEWQREQFREYFDIDLNRTCILRNAIAPCFTNLFHDDIPILSQKSQPPILAYISTPFRGLDLLLKVFPQIRQAVPGTILKVFSSMGVYNCPKVGEELMFGQLYRQCRETEGVEYIGSIPQHQLVRELRSSLILAYPNTYPETSCIAAMEAMASGCRIVTSDLAALPETTAGFARLVSVAGVKNFSSLTNWNCASKAEWKNYADRFVDENVRVLREYISKDTVATEIHLRQQVKYVNSSYTWSVRAEQWIEWLDSMVVKTVRVAEQMITESLVNLEATQAHFNKANWLKEAGQLDAAIDSYKQARDYNPDDAEIHKKLAEVYVLKGQLDEAIASCKFALKLKPDFAPAYLTLGNALSSQDRLELAIQAYSQALKIDSNFAEAHANLGSMYYKLGQLDNAANSYQKALIINPDLASVYLMLGNVWQQQWSLSEAISCYQKAIRLQPLWAKLHDKLGDALAKINNRDEAIACYQKVLRLQPGSAETSEKLSSLLKLKSQEDENQTGKEVTGQNPILELEKEGEGQQPESIKQDEEYGLQPSSLNLPQSAQDLSLNQPFDNTSETTEQVSNFNVNPPEAVANFQEVEEYKKRAEAYLLQGNFREAIASCQLALKIRPDFITAYVTLGNALHAQGKMDAAIRAYEQALELEPNYAEVRANIGSMYFKMGRLEEAITYYQQASVLRPDLAGIHWNLGKAFQKQGKSAEATACFQKTAELNPHLVGADFHFNLANTLLNEGKREEAIASYERAIAVKPDWAEAYANIGTARMQQGNLEAAAQFYQKAIAIKPELNALYFNIANTFLHQGKYDEAISNYQEAIKHKPDWPDAIANMGNAFSMQGKLEEAIASYEQALVHKPDWAEIYCRMGHIQKQDNPLAAIAHFEKAIELNPHFSEAHQQLCDLLSHSSNLAGARKVADKYCEYCGESVPVMAATAYIFSYLQSGVSELAIQKLIEIEKLSYQSCETFSVIDIKLLYEIFLFAVSHLRDDREANANFYKLIAKEYYKKAIPQRPNNSKPKPSNYPIKQRHLRIGFLSKHFRRHSVGWCSEALIRELTHITPHVHLYVTGKLHRDEVTERFEQMAGKFYWPKKYPNGFADGGEILEEVLQDNLDILIDLDSMTVPTNVEVLYYYPASVCISWLGFDAPYLSENHYFLCDKYTHPAGVEKHYIEQLVRLPECSVAISGLQSISADRNALRKSLGIGLDQMTYLCVAPGRKTNPEMLRAQVKILKEVPDSLLIRKGQGDPEVIHTSYRQECDAQGVDFNRIKFLGQTKTEEEHRAIYYIADVLLDSYPYNGGTHNLEALWANLPVVTRAGNQYLSRMGYAFLKSVNLDVGVAWNWEEYTQWGIKFGRDPAFRNAVREHLIRSKQPENLAPLWNPKKLAQEMYEVFQELLAKQV